MDIHSNYFSMLLNIILNHVILLLCYINWIPILNVIVLEFRF